MSNLKDYDNSWYRPGGTALKRLIWYFVDVSIMRSHWNPLSGLRVSVLRWFGAKIGEGVVIKPGVSVKYPWRLTVGNYTWIGENVWIDNLWDVAIGNNCCLSQGAMLLCGNHDFKKETFDLIVKPIIMEDGAWAGAKSVVCPGVTLHKDSILSVGSIATKDLEAGGIYQGNPAVLKRLRKS